MVGTQPVLLTTELAGRTSPYRIAEIRPRISGRIQKLLFTEGADVNEGQDLYEIDPSPFQAALDEANAALSHAQAKLPAMESKAKRYQKGLADGAVSQQDFEDASAELWLANAELAHCRAMVETASINLRNTRVVSPMTGRIGRSSVTEGAVVSAYQIAPLAIIQQLNPIYVDMPHSANGLLELKRRVKEGHLNQNKVQLIMEDGSVYPVEGTFDFREVSADLSTDSFILRAVFPNPNGVLLPYMLVRAVVKDGNKDEGILIPQQCVGRDLEGNLFACVVDKTGKVERRLLSVHRAVGDQWLISSGLKAGEHIVAERVQGVQPGALVKEVQFQTEQKESPTFVRAGSVLN